ncbi:von Willebrand factor C and EGF domain-containing protein [Talpa occidentalis]|uniref:von Willebrand factor C and EGF domain-containing protein n=1 Tax=Talpa occidentalis TaxID=50954 RepID=UPI00188E9D19|nr:von Willebrand factor C and EGF domain-containing protein [Talpa occidentalis]
MWAGLLLRAACVALLLPGAPARGHSGRKPPGLFSAERRRLGPHVCLSGFGSGCCPGWAPSLGSGHCTLPLCSFGCGSGICIAPNVCSCQDGEQGATCPAHRPCGEYGCDLACNHGGCQEVARVCPVGFSMTETDVGIRCTDIDECLSSSCEGHCVNTEGGFVCECGPGMQLSADRHSCQDTDECLGSPCQQRCKNSIGSYRCSCRTGFHLHGNRHSCVDVNECRRPLERRICHHSCHNTVGSFLCTCRPGFRLRADRVSCEALPKAVLAPSAILQPLQPPPKMLLLLPEAGRPALSPGHSPPPGAPGPPSGVRTTRLPPPTPAPPTSSPSAPGLLRSTPMSSAPLVGTLGPPSQLQKAVVTPSWPRGPAATPPALAPSACWHLGAMYGAGSRWTGPGCSQCRCENGEVTCEKVTCEAACSHPIPSGDGGCCPSCTGCFHGGVTHAEGDVFSPPDENCTVCVCLAGNVSCISPECPPGPCHTSPPSHCCTCVPVRCYFHGRWYPHGAVLSGGADECTTCVCQNGEVECSFTPCPELSCPREEWWLGPGQCCFTCREPTPTTGCSLDDNGVEFPIGQIWSPGDPCELCICQADGSVNCKRTDCVDSCPHPIRIPGQCCPDCSAGCTYTGRIFYNNETFPSVLDPCLSCICLLGTVACSPVDCPITCTYPFHPDGECCPVCRDCNYEGRKVVNGQVFTLDDEPCTQCTCQLGEVSCERVPCHRACTDPSAPPGGCCSSCPDSLLLPEGSQGLSPRGDSEFSQVARSPRGDTEAPVNCSSCLGPSAGSPQRPALQLLQLLLGGNLSQAQTLTTSRSGAQASPSAPFGPGGSLPGEHGASRPPRPSPGPSLLPGASPLPPASPGAPGTRPLTPEPSSSAFGAQTASRRPFLPVTTPTEAPTLSSTAPSPSENPSTLLRPPRLSPTISRLSAALAATASAQEPATEASREEEAAQ